MKTFQMLDLAEKSHSEVHCAVTQGFETPNELAEVPAYLSRLQGRQSWKNTFYSEDQVIAGWAAH